MSELEESFAKLLGRQPSDEDRQRLYRVKDALGLANNDALWLVLIALEHYQTLYDRVPQQIATAARDTLGTFEDAARASALACAEAAKSDLTKAVATASTTVASQVAGKQRLQWLGATVAVCCLALTATGWLAFSLGHQGGKRFGYVSGYEAAKDERAAASWAATPAGRQALRLSHTGSIDYLATCSRPGWKARDGVCYPGPAEDGHIYGWRIPR